MSVATTEKALKDAGLVTAEVTALPDGTCHALVPCGDRDPDAVLIAALAAVAPVAAPGGPADRVRRSELGVCIGIPLRPLPGLPEAPAGAPAAEPAGE